MSAEDEQPEREPDAAAEQQPVAEAPSAGDTPAADAAEEAAGEQPAEDEPAAEEQPSAGADAGDQDDGTPAAEDEPAAEKAPRKRGVRRPRRKQAEADAPAEEEPAAKPRRGKAAKAPAPSAEKAKEPAAAPRRGKAPSRARRRVVRARARYVRTSARKARMVCGHLRGKSVQEARAILAFTPREAARDWSKLLESAVANAESNHELLEEDLFVGEAYADEGPTIKRFRPRAMGRATPIAKRTSHLTIALSIRPEPAATSSRKRKKD